jgi:hypothetical protein
MAAARMYTGACLHVAWNFTEGGVLGASVTGGGGHGLFAQSVSGPQIVSSK